MRLLVTPTSFYKNKKWVEYIESRVDEVVYNTTGKPLTEGELIELALKYSADGGFDGCIAGLDFYTENVMRAMLPSLKVISRYGVGCERVDTRAAQELGIAVRNTPGANTQAVADLTFGHILSCARMIPYLSKCVREGMWPRNTGTEIYSKKIGIIGLGAIGKAVAKRATGFSMEIMAYDPYLNEDYARDHGIKPATLEQILTQCDIITLHIPYSEATHHIIGRKQMSIMKKGVIIVNTSRGGLIDEDAAADYIENGTIAGMGLDAFSQEPPARDCRLFKFDNVILTPHTGAHTKEAGDNMAATSVQNLFEIIGGIA